MRKSGALNCGHSDWPLLTQLDARYEEWMTDVEPLSADERLLLSDHDDDLYGLWEVDWHFNGRRPEWPFEERAAVVSAMVKRGLFDVFFGPLQTKRPPLELGAALKALADPTSWAPPLDGQKVGFYVATSPAGIAAQRFGS